MTPMQSSTNKLTLVLLCCLAFAGFAGLGFCEGGGGGRGRRPMMEIQPPMAPVAQGSIPDQRLYEGAAETLDVEPYFTDPDSESLTYSVASGDASVATAAVSGSMVTIRGRVAGTAEVRVTATDPEGLTADQDFTVRVEAVAAPAPPPPPVAPPPSPPANLPPRPEVDILDRTLLIGGTDTFGLETHFSDPNGDRLTYRVAIAPGTRMGENRNAATVIVSESGMVTITAGSTSSALGTVKWRVTAEDPEGEEAYQDFDITVDTSV